MALVPYLGLFLRGENQKAGSTAIANELLLSSSGTIALPKIINRGAPVLRPIKVICTQHVAVLYFLGASASLMKTSRKWFAPKTMCCSSDSTLLTASCTTGTL